MNTDHKIWHEIYVAFEKLGAQPDLLAIVGSRYDTLDDETVLQELAAYNKGHRMDGISHFTSN